MPTTKAALRYPAAGAAVNVPQDIQNLASDLDGLAGAYGSTAARDSANTSPASNDFARAGGVGYIYRASAWHLIPDADQGPAWTNLSLSSGWSSLASGVTPPRYRLNGGKIEFDGGSFYTGSIGTAGVQLCTAVTAVASAVPANAANFWRENCMGMDGSGNPVTGFNVRFVADGRLFIHAPATQTNAAVNLLGVSISQ